MPVPTTGPFRMFDPFDISEPINSSIRGTHIHDSNSPNTSIPNFSGLISNSEVELFDPTYSGTIESLSDVSSSLQFRNYGIVSSTGFNTNLGTGFNSTTEHIAIQSDGKIVICGSFVLLNGNNRKRLVRLNSNGTEDTSFYTNLGTGFSYRTQIIAIQSDGKILVGGEFTSFNGNTRNGLVRLKFQWNRRY